MNNEKAFTNLIRRQRSMDLYRPLLEPVTLLYCLHMFDDVGIDDGRIPDKPNAV